MTHPNPGLNIVAWLEAAITRREETARAVGYERIETVDYLWGTKYLLLKRGDESKATAELDAELADHIALNDPQAVLRRCTGDRALLHLHGGRGHTCPALDGDGDVDERTEFYDHEVCPVLQYLADGYGWTGGETL